ncbi:hypothetical protein GQ53DRAFT_225820 [Thozetella sp. PMI_491]|nr:hypothetical protein GQ53DRAFT_225820 [Thozetella sp. PMI_491]
MLWSPNCPLGKDRFCSRHARGSILTLLDTSPGHSHIWHSQSSRHWRGRYRCPWWMRLRLGCLSRLCFWQSRLYPKHTWCRNSHAPGSTCSKPLAVESLTRYALMRMRQAMSPHIIIQLCRETRLQTNGSNREQALLPQLEDIRSRLTYLYVYNIIISLQNYREIS